MAAGSMHQLGLMDLHISEAWHVTVDVCSPGAAQLMYVPVLHGAGGGKPCFLVFQWASSRWAAWY